MKQLERKPILLAAVLIALLLIAIPASAQQPACPTGGRTTTSTYTNGSQTVYLTVPFDAQLCPQESTGGCCDKIVVTGLTPGWTIEGNVQIYFFFTTKYPDGDPRQRMLYNSFTIPVTPIGDSGKFVESRICYPPAHGWPSAEMHVDFNLVVKDENGLKVPWIGDDLTNAPGTLGPGGRDWDPTCYSLGCTPGYWKTHPNAWPPSLTPATTTFYGVFGKYASWDQSLLLIEGAGASGSKGKDANMVRQCSAAYVGAVWYSTVYNNTGKCGAWGVYLNGGAEVTPADIVKWVQDAYNDGSKAAFANAQDKCTSLNENSICGPNGPWLNTETGSFGDPACLLPSGIPATPKLIP